jgi:uncharacterized delta-60 repeat protein
MKNNILILIFFVCLFLQINVSAQIGSLDPNFNTLDNNNSLMGANGEVLAMAEFPDGKIILGGQFSRFNDQTYLGIVKLNSDGSIDTSFEPGQGISGDGATVITSIDDFAIQPDGKIIVVGQFQTFNGQSSNRIVRLNSDGSIDTGFNVGSGFNSSAFEVELMPNGQILVGGYFGYYNGMSTGSLARLNPDGSLDASFNSVGTNTTGANNYIQEVVLLNDGKILIGGVFTAYNGVNVSRIARLNANGTLDTSYNVGAGADSWVECIHPMNSGKYLVSGTFSTFNGQSFNQFVMLNTDGSIDESFFNVNNSGNNGNAYEAIELNDGRILVGGIFSSIQGTDINYLTVLNPDGTIDSSIDFGTGPSGGIQRMLLTQDGQLLIVGSFTSFNGAMKHRIAKIILCQPQLWYQDSDGDGYAAVSVTQCDSPGAGWTTLVLPLGDCNDQNTNVRPGATEWCSSMIDEDCDGVVDEAACNLNGYVFVGVDLNANGIYDAGDQPLANYPVHVTALGGTVFTSVNGWAYVEYPQFDPEVTVNGNANYINSTPNTASFSINQIGTALTFLMVPNTTESFYILNNYYGIWGNRVHCTNGMDAGIFINNQGGQNLFASMTLSATPALNLSASSNIATIPPTEIIDGAASWINIPIAIGNSGALAFHLFGPGAAALGSNVTLNYNVVITDENGIVLYDTGSETTHQVVCAFDPNDLLAEPVGYEAPHYIAAGEEIEYRARFQNTGNIAAQNVRLEGNLNPAVYDLSSFQVIAASHAYSTLIYDNGDFVIQFDNIWLPDSISDEPNSHGFALYKATLRSDLAAETTANQFISIFFDENDPIVTNDVFHTIYDCASMIEPVVTQPLCWWSGSLSAEQSYVDTYSWSFDGEVISETSEVLIELAAGNYQINLIMENPICSRTITYPFTVDTYPQVLGLPDDLNSGFLPDTVICIGEQFIPNAYCDECTILWDNNVSNGTPVDLLPTQWNYFSGNVVGSTGCESSFEFTVGNFGPQPVIAEYSSAPFLPPSYLSWELYDPFASYQWFLNNEPVDFATGNSWNPNASGDYYLEVIDQYGCVGVSNTITWFEVSIEEQVGSSLEVFPNPVLNKLTIKSKFHSGMLQVELFDAVGKRINSYSFNSPFYELDLSNLPAGNYVLKSGSFFYSIIKL